MGLYLFMNVFCSNLVLPYSRRALFVTALVVLTYVGGAISGSSLCLHKLLNVQICQPCSGPMTGSTANEAVNYKISKNCMSNRLKCLNYKIEIHRRFSCRCRIGLL